MNINQSLINSTTFDQLQRVVETIKTNNSVHFFEGSKIKVGTETVDIVLIKEKFCDIFNSRESAKWTYDDYENYVSLLYQLQTLKESDRAIKQLFRQIFAHDAKISTIHSNCLSSLKMFESAPTSHKIEDCQTIASLKDLIKKMHEAQKDVNHHREHTRFPIKEIQSRLYVLYKTELKRHPEKESHISYITFLAIQQLNLIQPRSSKKIFAIDVLEKKCIQSIREDKILYNSIKSSYNTIVMEQNNRVMSKYLYGHVPHKSKTDVLELSRLEKIVGKNNFLQFFKSDFSLIEPAFNRDDPEDVKQCLETYVVASTLCNYVNNLPKDIQEENLQKMKFQLRCLANACGETLNIPLSFKQKWLNDSLPQILFPGQQDPIELSSLELPELLDKINQRIHDLNQFIAFDHFGESDWKERLNAILPPAAIEVTTTKEISSSNNDDDFFNETVKRGVETALSVADPL